MKYLYALGGGLGVLLLAQTFFIFYAVMRAPNVPADQALSAGKTMTIGQAMYTEYLLPVEIVGVLLLMAVIGSVILARRLSPPQLELVIDNELEIRHEEEAKDGLGIAL